MTGRRRGPKRQLQAGYRAPSLKCMSFFIVDWTESRAFSVLCVYSKFGHHPHPLGYLCAKFRSRPLLLSWSTEKITHSAYFMPQKPKFPLRKSQHVVRIVVLLKYKIHMNTNHTLVIAFLLCCINLTANEYGAVEVKVITNSPSTRLVCASNHRLFTHRLFGGHEACRPPVGILGNMSPSSPPQSPPLTATVVYASSVRWMTKECKYPGALVNLGTKMNLLDFEVKRSKIKVTSRPCQKSGGIRVDSSPSTFM